MLNSYLHIQNTKKSSQKVKKKDERKKTFFMELLYNEIRGKT